jgi:hypothetical protein
MPDTRNLVNVTIHIRHKSLPVNGQTDEAYTYLYSYLFTFMYTNITAAHATKNPPPPNAFSPRANDNDRASAACRRS